MPNKVAITVVVPVYNRRERLHLVVSSLQQQDTAESYEILLVDDGSTDGSCDAFSNHSNIRVIYQENMGAAISRNTGAKNALGDIVIFHDSDDLAMPNKVRVLYDALCANPSSVAAFAITKEERSGWIPPDWTIGLGEEETVLIDKPYLHFFKELYPIASAMNIAMKKEIAVASTEDSGFYKAANDFHLQANASILGSFVGVNAITTHYYVDSKNSITRSFGPLRQLMFCIFSSVEVLEKSQKATSESMLVRNKVTIHGPTVILGLFLKCKIDKNFFKMVSTTLRYSYLQKLPRTCYWALSKWKEL